MENGQRERECSPRVPNKLGLSLNVRIVNVKIVKCKSLQVMMYTAVDCYAMRVVKNKGKRENDHMIVCMLLLDETLIVSRNHL